VVVIVASWLRRSVACAFAVLVLGCESHVIEHGPSAAVGSDTFASDVDGSTGAATVTSGFFGDSNFPEPALTNCGSLGEGVLPIDGLRSAWGVVAVSGSGDTDDAVEAGTVRVRLTEQRLLDCQAELVPQDCEDPGSSSSGFGLGLDCGWAFSFTLTPAEAVAGQLQLDALTDPDFEVIAGEHGATLNGIAGELEIYRVLPECIVGELTNVELDLGSAIETQSLDGAFAAELCQHTCLPTAEASCP
jgi:hypothetical protein